MLAGDKAFLLHDTYGFPIDLTLEMAAEQGLSVDEEGFRRADEGAARPRQGRRPGQEDRPRRPVRPTARSPTRSGATEFTGYDERPSEATVVGLLVDGVPSPGRHRGRRGRGRAGPHAVLRRGRRPARRHRPHHASTRRRHRGPRRPAAGAGRHRAQGRGPGRRGHRRRGRRRPRSTLIRRRAIARAHTATHLTHQALRDALGPTAAQAGSENAPGRFRFDFGSPGRRPGTVLTDVEQKINEW